MATAMAVGERSEPSQRRERVGCIMIIIVYSFLPPEGTTALT